MTKEQVYDEELNPLMDQVIAICKRKKIAMFATFILEDDLFCTTSLFGRGYGKSEIIPQLCKAVNAPSGQ